MKEGIKMDLYLPVYYKLEKEVMKLSDHIYMNDQHLQVYSMTIADLIVRISTEIESLSKKIYKDLGQVKRNSEGIELNPFFDKDCIGYMNDNFKICSKKIEISNQQIELTDKKITPLINSNIKDKDAIDRCKWKDAYQNLKHNRYEFLEVATVENLLHSLGALYILNIYNEMDSNEILQSNIFVPEILDVTKEIKIPDVFKESNYEGKREYEEEIYVKKFIDSQAKLIVEEVKMI